MRAKRAALDAAQAQRRAVRGRFGPSLELSASVNIWDSAFELPFVAGEPPVRVRDQLTTQLNVAVTQPISAALLPGYRIGKLGSELARIDQRKTAREVAYQTTKAYIQLKQAEAGAAIAAVAVSQVDAQLTQGRAFYGAGLIGKNDLLKLELGLAQARSQQISARAHVRLARSVLALSMGLSAEAALVAGDTFVDPPPSVSLSYAASVARALRQRGEKRLASKQAELATTNKDLAFWKLGPDIALLANYQNVQGQGLLMPKNTFFVGGALTWNLWAWGVDYYNYRKSQAQARQAKHAVTLAERAIVLEVKQAHLQLRVAREVLEVARKGIAQADEAYRIEQVKYQKQAATTRDVLDAQLAVTRAKLQRTNALYGFYLARAKLRSALGEVVGLENSR